MHGESTRRKKSYPERCAEIDALTARLTLAVSVALATDGDPRDAWTEVATHAGKIERRARVAATYSRSSALLDEAARLRRMAALARSDGRDDLAREFEAMAERDEREAWS